MCCGSESSTDERKEPHEIKIIIWISPWRATEVERRQKERRKVALGLVLQKVKTSTGYSDEDTYCMTEGAHIKRNLCFLLFGVVLLHIL